jgi:hypothetical protein
MNLLKEIKKLSSQHILLLAGTVVVVLYLSNYSSRLGSLFSGLENGNGNSSSQQNGPQQQNAPPVLNQVKAAMPIGENSGPGPVNGGQSIIGGNRSNCGNTVSANPSDLLPKNNNNQFGGVNSNGSNELSNVNLLKAGFHAGIDTVGGSLRNANLQIRSEPPNPRTNTGPWNGSTIEPDTYRRGLEIGCGN